MKERMCTHLLKIAGSSSYYFRRKIPEDLIAHYNKKEIKKSLRTSDRREAERLARIEGSKLDEEFASLRKPQKSEIQIDAPPCPPDLEALRETIKTNEDWERAQSVVNRYIGAKYRTSEKNVTTLSRQALETWRMRRDLVAGTPFYESFMSHMRSVMETNQEILDAGNPDLYWEGGEPLWRSEAYRNAARALLTGDIPLAWEHPIPEKNLSKSQAHASEADSYDTTSLFSLAEKWASERKPILKTINMFNRTIDRFRSMVGKMPAQAITRQHVIQFKDRLLASGQSEKNTNKQLIALKTLLNYASDNALIGTNPAVGVSVTVAVKERPRTSFDSAALNAIFNGPVYTQGLRPKAGGGEAAFWIPLLALFTGARLEELGQLHPSDVFEEPYYDEQSQQQTAWVVRFRMSKARNQQVKNATSNRRVPLHSEIIRLGFISLVREAQHEKRDRIFPELVADKYGVETAQFSKWFGRYLRLKCGVLDERMAFHSFRHSFKELCRQEDITVSDILTGHSSGKVADKYGGDLYPLRPLVNAMNKFRVPGLSLNHIQTRG